MDHLRSAISSRGSSNTKWDRVDSSIHAQCFTGMSLCEEGWCSLCASLDHVRTTCPFKPPVDYYRRPPSEGYQPPSDYQRPTSGLSVDYAQSRRPSLRTKPPSKWARPQFPSEEACRKWNRYNYMDCPHGDTCGYAHVCSNCREVNHGVLKCISQGGMNTHNGHSYSVIPPFALLFSHCFICS